MSPRFLLLLSLLILAPVVRGDDFEARTFTSPQGAKLPYQLLKPLNYEEGKKYPLVLFLHATIDRKRSRARMKDSAESTLVTNGDACVQGAVFLTKLAGAAQRIGCLTEKVRRK